MIQKPIRTLLLIGSLCGAAPLAHAEMKVGTIDMNRVFTEYYKTKDAEQKLNEQRAAAKKELDDRVETLKKSMDELNKLNAEIEKPELSKDARDAKIKDREQKIAEAKNLDKEASDFKGTRERQLQEQFLRMRKDIIDDIMKIVTARVTDAGYDLVFDKSGLSMGQIPVVIYSRDDMDFSKDIIAKLNANAPKVKPTEN
ncbi:MAG: OmpH family outer membrane protein [Terrimicrobiaceae bacterium]|nr:OmpH family outer membrane protein [Terrimicrobiaceae bacterium]